MVVEYGLSVVVAALLGFAAGYYIIYPWWWARGEEDGRDL